MIFFSKIYVLAYDLRLIVDRTLEGRTLTHTIVCLKEFNFAKEIALRVVSTRIDEAIKK